ncbi:hypothetical protein [Paenibacillus naphthalenovorans]|uniref:hypothetical protein n=1 Tax=Paenibacillus naphthalenovorans TaxID=162209 RepID=UPI003D29D1D3
MIDLYANQTVIWKKKLSVNDYNEPDYDSGSQIDCRLEYKRKMVRDTEGQEVLSESAVYTETAVKIGDVIIIDGIDWNVISSNPQYDLFGEIVFYEVRL